jgi:hypothetical protein
MPVLRQEVQWDQHGKVLLERLQAEGQVPAGEAMSGADSYTTKREER